MKTTIRLVSVLVACWVATGTALAQQDANASNLRKGVIFIASKKGDVVFSLGGNVLPAAKVKVNDSLGEGTSVETGANGSTILLFSNGTVATIGPSTTVRLRRFTQEKFEAGDRKMADLEEEPSISTVELDFDFGDLVVGTKKLKRDSSLNIHSPIGVAGIRGTQFRVANSAAAGFSLDVTESTVAFTPKGAAAPVPVTANRGLDVSVAGVVAPRPVNPVAAQTIAASNTGAFAMTAEVSLEEVSVKMEEATAAAPPEEPKEEPKEQEPKEEPVDEPAEPTSEPTEPAPEADSTQQAAPSGDLVAENNPNVKEGREKGVIDSGSKWIAETGLSDEQSDVFFAYEADLREQIMKESPEMARGLLDLDPPKESLQTFFAYATATKEKILQLESADSALSLLAKRLDETLITALLTEENLGLINEGTPAVEPASTEQAPEAEPLDQRERNLLEASILNGNDSLLSHLLILSEGELNGEWLEKGETGNRMLTDHNLDSALPASMLFEEKELGNPFYAEAKAVFDATSPDAGLPTTGFSLYAGRKVTLLSGIYALSETSEDELYLTAAESLTLEGEINFGNPADGKTRVVLMSGGTLDAKTSGTGAVSFTTAVSDLVVTARETVSLKDVSLAAGANLYLESLSDLIVEGGFLSASDLLSLRASRTLSIDSTRFADTLKDIRMRADTIDLRKIDFPSGAEVLLQSLRGPIDGKYPTFGSGSWQYGRVNFLEEVKQGGNSLMTRPLFDAHGRNVTIGKIPGR